MTAHSGIFRSARVWRTLISANLSRVLEETVARASTPAGPRVVSASRKSAQQPTLQAWRLAPRAEIGLISTPMRGPLGPPHLPSGVASPQ
jgi:hypothetical protein